MKLTWIFFIITPSSSFLVRNALLNLLEFFEGFINTKDSFEYSNQHVRAACAENMLHFQR